MRTFNLSIVLLCLALLAALPFIPNKPAHLVEWPVRAQITDSLQQAMRLADAQNRDGALKLVAGLDAIPDTTFPERTEIGQVRSFIARRQHP